LLKNSQKFSFASQPNSRRKKNKKKKTNARTTKFMSGTKKPSCPWNRDIIQRGKSDNAMCFACINNFDHTILVTLELLSKHKKGKTLWEKSK
jgi:hypothetical protein